MHTSYGTDELVLITMSGVAGAQELNGVKGRFRVRDCADTGCRQGWVQGGHPGNPMT